MYVVQLRSNEAYHVMASSETEPGYAIHAKSIRGVKLPLPHMGLRIPADFPFPRWICPAGQDFALERYTVIAFRHDSSGTIQRPLFIVFKWGP